MATEFVKSMKYDKDWIRLNMMGPNPIQLLELLSNKMDLRQGMRVLDLGCGMALTSIFLAMEFNVETWATDLWIPASANYKRIIEAGLDGKVHPIHAEAHDLPYADEFFDAVVSIDAYHYFGTDPGYMDGYCARLLKPGGQIGVVVPGVSYEIGAGLSPEGLEEFWDKDFDTFHTADWWESLWKKSNMIETEVCEKMPLGKKIWQESEWRQGEHGSDNDKRMLMADKNDALAMIMLTGRRKCKTGGLIETSE
ncbi:MAG: methyltransferase domain-containing protein [Clostridia bacterium]|nr:methyltransferase domain-containing protein [Clostridia bacterium]